MFRTVADDTPSPAAVTSSDEATGSPDVMYSRTRAARTRRDRSGASISTRIRGLLKIIQQSPAKAGYDKGYAIPRRSDDSGPVCQLAARHAALRDDFGPIDPHRGELVDQQLAVHDSCADIAAARGVHESRVRIRSGRQVR